MYDKVTYPPEYVRFTPILFNFWSEWVDLHKEQERNRDNMQNQQDSGDIKPLGEIVGPDWMKFEFDNYEDFYKYYCELLDIEYR